MFILEKLSDKAVLTIYGYVGGYYLDFRAVEKALREIKGEGYTQLDFWLHTYGGDVFEGNLIKTFMDQFTADGGEIDLYAPGVLASMGAVIMMSATRVHLVKNGFIMIHAPSGGAFGNAKDMEQTAKQLRSIEKNFISELSTLGITERQAKTWMDGSNYWFDSEEALKRGLITSVIDPKVKDITTLEKEEVETLGAKGAFEKFAALTTDNPNSKKSDMDKKSLIARYGLTTVTDANTDEEIMAAIDAKINASKKEADDAKKLLSDGQKVFIEAAVTAAITATKIAKEKKEKYVAMGEKIGLQELNAIFEDMQVYTTINDKLGKKKPGADGGTGTGTEAHKDWDWDKYQKEDSEALEALQKSDEKAFNALYKAKYKVEPSN